jgi:hypothetical protein
MIRATVSHDLRPFLHQFPSSQLPPRFTRFFSIDSLEEVRQAHLDGHLADIQMRIFEARIQEPGRCTYKTLLKHFDSGLSGCEALRHCLKQAASLWPWDPYHGGGREWYLSVPDEVRLDEQLLEAAENLQYMRTRYALNCISMLKEERCEKEMRESEAPCDFGIENAWIGEGN